MLPKGSGNLMHEMDSLKEKTLIENEGVFLVKQF